MKVFCHRYKYSSDKLRAFLKRKLKEGVVTLEFRTKDGYLYNVPDDLKLPRRKK